MLLMMKREMYKLALIISFNVLFFDRFMSGVVDKFLENRLKLR